MGCKRTGTGSRSLFFLAFIVFQLFIFTTMSGLANAFGALPGSVVYVNPDPGITQRDGLSWETGLAKINEGLSYAALNEIYEVWVKEGTYNESVALKWGVSLYGGFAGTETDRSQRKWSLHPTVIDAGSPTLYSRAVIGENDATIDGFTITGGHAYKGGNPGENPAAAGGGIYNLYVSPTVRNCIVTGNSATGDSTSRALGAGVYNESCGPVFENVVIYNNTTVSEFGCNGAAMYNLNSNPGLYNVTVTGNDNATEGPGSGAIANEGECDPVLYNVIVWHNGTFAAIDDTGNTGSPQYNYSDIEGWSGGGTNFSLDPLFESDGYRLSSSSPCIDSGYSEYFIPAFDFEGDETLDYLAVPNSGGGLYANYRDIGADEYVPKFLVPGEYWVDIASGTDDALHGTGPGSSAWKTLHWALQLINHGAVGTPAFGYTLNVGSGIYSVPTEADMELMATQSYLKIVGIPQDTQWPVLDGTDSTAWKWGAGINIAGQDITVEGLEIRFFDSGIRIESCSPKIVGNIIHDIAWYGIYMFSSEGMPAASPLIQNNLVYISTDPFQASDASGIYIYSGEHSPQSYPEVYHNTLVGCSTCPSAEGAHSKGIYMDDYYGNFFPIVKYNIVAHFRDLGIYTPYFSPQNVTLDYNDFWNPGGDYSGCDPGPNDISDDPLVSLEEAYYLHGGSPCRNAIPESDSDPVDNDLLGVARPHEANKDIGCYEFVPILSPGVYHVDMNRPDDSGDGSSDSPWKYIHTAFHYINGGSAGNYELQIASGTYSVASSEPDEQLLLTQDNVKVVGQEGAVVDGTGALAWSVGIKVSGQSVVVENLEISNFEDCGIAIADCSPTIQRNMLKNNGFCGIGVLADKNVADPLIQNNLIVNQSPNAHGIVIATKDADAFPKVYHNTIDGPAVSGEGCGIWIRQIGYHTAYPEIMYNIVTNHGNCGIYNENGIPVLYYNDVWNNPENYKYIEPGANDISEAPRFASWRLQYGSPCIDGIPAGILDPVAEDLEGNPRPKGAGFDIGCYEHEAISPGTYYVDIDNGEDLFGNGTQANPWKTLHYALALVNGGEPGTEPTGYTLYVKQGLYSVSTGEARDPLYVYQNYATIEGESGAIVQRDGEYNWEDGFVIAGHNVVVRKLQIQGFYYGVRIEDCSPTIEKNNISDSQFCGVRINALAMPTNPVIRNNYIYTTRAASTGIYIEANFDASPAIYHNTILGGADGTGIADGVFIKNDGGYNVAPRIAFNIIGEFPGFGIHNSGGNLHVFYNDVYNNDWGNYAGFTPGPGTSDINIDPQLYDGYKLAVTSPCIDAIPVPDEPPGHPVTDDIEGTLRSDAQGYNSLQGDAFDMGCYEYPYTPIEPSTFYVDIVNANAADDLAHGMYPTMPWKTLHYAILTINRGMPGSYRLIVAPGTYSTTVTGGELDAGLTVFQEGLIIEGSTSGASIIDGAGASNWHWGIEVEADNVVFRNLYFTGFIDSEESAIAIRTGTGNSIENCVIYGNRGGIVLSAGSSGNFVGPGCKIFRNMTAGILIDGSSGNEIYDNSNGIFDNGYLEQSVAVAGIGIKIANGADNNKIHDNGVYWSGEPNYPQSAGIVLAGVGAGNEIYGNTIHDHTNGEAYTGGVLVYDSSPQIYRNKLYNNHYCGISILGESSEASPQIVNNLIYNAAGVDMDFGVNVGDRGNYARPHILHNTIDGAVTIGIGIFQGVEVLALPVVSFNIIGNNDGCGISSDIAIGNVGDWNNFWNNSGGDHCEVVAGSNDMFQDPMYGSYTLQYGSPCIDAIPLSANDPVSEDLLGNPRPQGAGSDMGAYEMPPAPDTMLTVSVTPTIGGTVAVNGESCGGGCAKSLPQGSTATLVATPNQNYGFVQWEDVAGNVVGTSATLTVAMVANYEVTAIFAEETVNRPPVLGPIGDKTVKEGETLAFALEGSDPDDNALTYGAESLPDGASLIGPEFSWTPGHDQIGIHSVTFFVSDGSFVDSETVRIIVLKVAPENSPPVLNPIGNKTVDEGRLLSFDVSATDSDPGDVLIYLATGLPEGAFFSGATFSWTPSYRQAGTHAVTFSATDGKDVVSEQIEISVNNVNTPPIIQSVGGITANEGAIIEFRIEAFDPEGDTLVYSAQNLPQGAVFDPIARLFSWTPAIGQSGSYSVEFAASDEEFTATETVEIMIATSMPVPPSPFPYDRLTPAKGATEIDPAGLCFSWPQAANADGYRLVVGKNGDFGSPVFQADNIAETTYCVPGAAEVFDYGTVYEWKVVAVNANGSASYPVVGFYAKLGRDGEEQPEVVLENPKPLDPFQSQAISFPLVPATSNLAALLNPLLGAYGTDWKLYRHDSSGARKEYPDVPAATPGISYWLSTRKAATLNVRGKTVDFSKDFAIKVPPGLFQLGCPFPFPVDWDEVKVRAGQTVAKTGEPSNRWVGPLWNENYQFADKLVPWKGNYIVNYSSQTVELLVPPIVGGK